MSGDAFLPVGRKKKKEFYSPEYFILFASTFSSQISHLFHMYATAAKIRQRMHTTTTATTCEAAVVVPGGKQGQGYFVYCVRKRELDKKVTKTDTK